MPITRLWMNDAVVVVAVAVVVAAAAEAAACTLRALSPTPQSSSI